MVASLSLIALGLLIIIGNILKHVFVVKKIPDIIFLILIGIIIGPVAGLISPSDLGILGPIFSLATLVIILFEGGLNLRIQAILGSLRGATLLAVLTFITTVILSAGLFMAVLNESRMTAIIFGCIIGGLSPAVVLPLIRHLSVSENTRTILTIESALADVLCIICVISIINLIQSNAFTPLDAFLNLGESFFIAIGIGIIGGVLWIAYREQVKKIESIFTTPAFVCLLYGFTELFGGSGAISVLVFGIILGNLCFLEKVIVGGIAYCPREPITQKELELFNQLVDLLKTFFFIYIGISIVFVSPFMILFCIGLLFIIHLFRIPIVIATIKSQIPTFDFYVASGMIPKGLASAVLASIPAQYGISGAEELQPLVYIIVIISIFSSTIIAFILEKKNGGKELIKEDKMAFLPAPSSEFSNKDD